MFIAFAGATCMCCIAMDTMNPLNLSNEDYSTLKNKLDHLFCENGYCKTDLTEVNECWDILQLRIGSSNMQVDEFVALMRALKQMSQTTLHFFYNNGYKYNVEFVVATKNNIFCMPALTLAYMNRIDICPFTCFCYCGTRCEIICPSPMYFTHVVQRNVFWVLRQKLKYLDNVSIIGIGRIVQTYLLCFEWMHFFNDGLMTV